jgi:multidrug efflux pump
LFGTDPRPYQTDLDHAQARVASGAGAEMRRTLGTAVFSGMIGVTGFGIFLTPVFYYAIMRLADPGGAGPSAEKVTEKVQEATADGPDGKKRAVEEPGQEITREPR